jgi:hypothetical protein
MLPTMPSKAKTPLSDRAPDVRPAAAQVGRRLQQDLAQDLGDLGDLPLEGRIGRGVLLGELGDLRLGERAVAGDLQVGAVRQRAERARVPVHDGQAVALQLEIADHLGVQQADHVGADRVPEAGVELLGDRRAADHMAPFDHLNLEARTGQIAGAGQAVVAGADHDDVVGPGAGR